MSSKNAAPADNQQTIRRKISDEYLAGFVDKERCFYVGFSKRKDLPLVRLASSHWISLKSKSRQIKSLFLPKRLV
jgi:hypothetical protein